MRRANYVKNGENIMAVTKKLVEQLCDSSTALVVNAVEWLGESCPFTDSTIQYMTPEFPPLCGEAITVKYTACDPNGTEAMEEYWDLLERMRETNVPKVVVIEAVGDLKRECVSGDGMAKQFLSSNAVGLITNGGHRDIKDIIKVGFKTFGSGHVVGHYAMRFFDVGKPAKVGGMEVRTGDLIHADVDGCVIIPESTHEDIVKACRMTLDCEKRVHTNWRVTEYTPAQQREHADQMAEEMKEAIRADRKSDY